MPRSGIWGTYQEHLKPAAQEGSMAVGAPECGVPENSNWAVAPRGQGAGGCRIRAFAWLVNEPWPPGADASCEFCQSVLSGRSARLSPWVCACSGIRAGRPKARGDGGARSMGIRAGRSARSALWVTGILVVAAPAPLGAAIALTEGHFVDPFAYCAAVGTIGDSRCPLHRARDVRRRGPGPQSGAGSARRRSERSLCSATRSGAA